MSREYSEGGSGAFTAFVAGLAIGGLLGVLLAPRPGRETRKVLFEKAEDLGERVSEMVDVAREKVRRSPAHTDGGM